MSAVRPSWGKVEPVGQHLLSAAAIVARVARATLGNEVDADWEGFEADYDQFNTTIYGHNDRYRGIKKGRQVVFVNPVDLEELGFQDGQFVDVHGEYADGKDRVLRRWRVVSYPTARGCAAACCPEANVLVPLDDTVKGSNTPVSKGVIVRLEPASGGPAGSGDAESAVADRPATV